MMIGQVSNLAIFILAWRFIERKRMSTMLLSKLRAAGSPLLLGILSGIGTSVFTATLMMAAGTLRLSWQASTVSGRASIAGIGFMLASTLLGPLTEEIESRGYLFQNVSRGWGAGIATIGTALVFSARHLQNPHVNAIGVLNIALISIAITLGMLYLRSLWYAIGWHVAWNSSLIFLFGSANSGFDPQAFGLSGISLFSPSFRGVDCMTGGAFGMEGSVVTTVVISVEIVILWRIKARSA